MLFLFLNSVQKITRLSFSQALFVARKLLICPCGIHWRRFLVIINDLGTLSQDKPWRNDPCVSAKFPRIQKMESRWTDLFAQPLTLLRREFKLILHSSHTRSLLAHGTSSHLKVLEVFLQALVQLQLDI